MIKEPMLAVYEGDCRIRLAEPPKDLQKEQELLVTILPIPVKHKAAGKRRSTPLAYFRQLVSKLRYYEEKYGITSEEFYQGFQSGKIQEGPLDYFDWRILYNGYRRMQEQFHFSPEQLANQQM
jgi:hypothetical protein